MIIAVSSVWLLYLISARPNTVKNGFKRTFIKPNLEIVNTISRNNNIVNIIGRSANHFYFQTKDPEVLAITTQLLDSLHFVSIDISDKEKIGASFHCEIDFPYYYVFAGNMRSVIISDLSRQLNTSYFHTNYLFTRAVRLSPSAFMFRGFDTSYAKKDQIFIKQDTAYKVKMIKNFTERINDAGFSTDGLLHYDKVSGKLLFIRYYTNQFICFDTSFNLVYKESTIDTIKSIKPAETISNKTSKIVSFTQPMQPVNYYSCIDQSFVYNNSTLQADNENDSAFRNNSSIDIYSIKTGKYMGSFYIPAFNSEKLKYFKVYGNALVVLYQKHIVTYKLTF